MPEPTRAARGENIAKIVLENSYGYRKVIEEAPRHHTTSGGYRLWLCECLVCGRRQKLQAHEILNPQGKQCLRCRNRSRRQAEAPFNKAVGGYRRNARTRNLEWALSNSEVKVLFESVCHYCGSEPSNLCRPSTTSASDPQPDDRNLRYSGIDRKDNSLGYTLSNVVPCCQTCNRAKFKMTYEQFQSWLAKAALHGGKQA